MTVRLRADAKGKTSGTLPSIQQSLKIQFPLSSSKVKSSPEGIPRWPSGKESTCQCRRHRFDPWSGKIPHAAGHLSLCTTTTESMHPRAHALQQEKPPQWEAQALRLESSPHSPQLQKNPGSNKDSAQTKIKKWNYLKKNDFHLQHCICLYHCLVELRENIVAELCPNSRFVSHINAVLSQKLERWFVTQK